MLLGMAFSLCFFELLYFGLFGSWSWNKVKLVYTFLKVSLLSDLKIDFIKSFSVEIREIITQLLTCIYLVSVITANSYFNHEK